MNPESMSATGRSIAGAARPAERVGHRRWACLTMLLILAVLAAAPTSSARSRAYTEKVIYSFAGTTDGAGPSGLIMDRKRDLYGTTPNGGNGNGNVFKVTQSGAFTNVWEFEGQPNDGADPLVALIADKQGNRYGTTLQGGKQNAGTVYEVTRTGKEHVLYNFTGLKDGSQPCSPLVMDATGNLYGVTSQGGKNNHGVVFEVTKAHKEHVLYNFTVVSYPMGMFCAGPIIDRSGNLYGTTYFNGTHGLGMVFKLSPKGVLTVRYNFCSATNCTDGANPVGGLVSDAAGNLYGTTYLGGDPNCNGTGCGVVFELSTAGQEKILHTFESNDGELPEGTLVRDPKGDLFGTASNGGTGGGGTVFEVTSAGDFKVLWDFQGPDGYEPEQALILDRKGDLYGTTVLGGGFGNGVVFELKP